MSTVTPRNKKFSSCSPDACVASGTLDFWGDVDCRWSGCVHCVRNHMCSLLRLVWIYITLYGLFPTIEPKLPNFCRGDDSFNHFTHGPVEGFVTHDSRSDATGNSRPNPETSVFIVPTSLARSFFCEARTWCLSIQSRCCTPQARFFFLRWILHRRFRTLSTVRLTLARNGDM